jgi:hypothetical protein
VDIPTAYRLALCTEPECSVTFKDAAPGGSQGTINRTEELTQKTQDNPMGRAVITVFCVLCVPLPHGEHEQFC